MLCELAFRDHRVLKREIPAQAMVIPAWGKPTTTERTDAVITPSLPPKGRPDALLASIP